MAVFKLESTNPDFSMIINKNPASGMQIRDLKKGSLFYWFKDNALCVRFVDAENDSSYGQGDFEYLDLTRYNSARFVLNAVKALLDDAWKDQSALDIDDKHTHKLWIGMIGAKKRYEDMFAKHFPDYRITWVDLGAGNYQLEVMTTKSLYRLLNFVNLMLVLILSRNDEQLYIDTDMVEKYIQCLKVIDTPYFIRYVFKVNFLLEFPLFQKYKPVLEENSRGEKIDMMYGSSQMMRRNAVQKFVNFDRQIVDIGAGEGFYMSSFSQKLKDKSYYAIDKEVTIREQLRKNADKKGYKNVDTTYESYDKYCGTIWAHNDSDVLMIEVIEHMPVEEAQDLVQFVVGSRFTKKLVITTPNADFNGFFLLKEGEYRHNDHQFEFTEKQFKDFIGSVSASHEVEFFEAGDKVNGICSTVGAVIRKPSSPD